jgi:hypothetical protein
MAYLTFDSLENRNTVMQESIATMGRQLWDGIKHMFNTDNWMSNDDAYANYLKDKRKYFNECFSLSPKLKAKLVQWCKAVPGVVMMSPSQFGQMMNGSNVESRKVTIGSYDSNSGFGVSSTRTVDHRERNEYSLHMKARENNVRNQFTHATCSYILDAGGGKAFLLFFTFDHEEIDVCQVLTQNKYSTGGKAVGYDFVRLPQWESVSREEYTKG